MCILPYMTLNQCSSFPGIYAHLEERVGSVCHGYMCFLLCVKLIWCSGFPEIYSGLDEVGEVSLPWVHVHSAICEAYLL